ncbi:hypothetical protein HI914_03468 [Erysiphe necator]|nr:hypothetical protein HI914_03468 [Erysiphe necator]
MAPIMRMGTFIFKWEHPAEEVYVTGSFDDWSKSERLSKTNNIFAKEVVLPIASDKIYYKFVVDGNWVTDHTAPQENDELGNLNNVLTVDKITILPPESVGIMSGVTADSTTVSMAGKVPLVTNQKYDSTTLPGTFPITPGVAEKAECEYLTKPVSIPELSNTQAAHDDHPTPFVDTSNNLRNGADEKTKNEKVFGVSPLPAFPGAVNPISIAPGEKLPDYSLLTPNTLKSNIDLKDEKHIQSNSVTDSLPTTDLASSQNESDIDKIVFSNISKPSEINDPVTILPIKLGMTDEIPNSPFIQSVGPQSTTATLASEVPIKSNLEQLSENTPESGVHKSGNEIKGSIDLNDSANTTDINSPQEIEGKLPNSLTQSSSISGNISGIEKESIIKQGQSLENLSNMEGIDPKIEVKKDHPSENTIKSSNEDLPRSPAPQALTEPAQTSQNSDTTTDANTEPKKVSSNSTSPACCVRNSSTFNEADTGNNEQTADEKTAKKKKRLSIFGKLKAKLTFKDKD